MYRRISRARNKIFHYPLRALIIALIFFTGYGAYNMISDSFLLFRESKKKDAELREALQNKKKLELRLAAFQSKEALLREAKARLNLKLPGEHVVVVVPERDSAESSREGFSLREKVLKFIKKFLIYK